MSPWASAATIAAWSSFDIEESHGLFGVLTPVPEPSIGWLLFAGLTGIGLRARRRD